MHILIAPNAFKNSLDAPTAAEAIREGLEQSKLKCACECFPVGDGGDGTALLLIRKCGGKVVPAKVHDPLGRKIRAGFGLIDNGTTAVIELADASGLRLLRREEYNPLRASTFGTGELIRRALDKGVSKIIIGIGGSATVDGGTGILRALGVRFLDANGKALANLPTDLARLKSIDPSDLDQRLRRCTLTVLCDVETTLLGKEGAAKVFGPQKGATGSVVKKLETALTTFRHAVLRRTGKDPATLKRGGAAGGVAAGLWSLLNARLANGIDHFLEVTGFDESLAKADLVITGEGRMDAQTLHGKGPFGVAVRAKKKKIPVIVLAGRVAPEAQVPLRKYFAELLAINDASVGLDKALRNTARDLRRTAKELGDRLAAKAQI